MWLWRLPSLIACCVISSSLISDCNILWPWPGFPPNNGCVELAKKITKCFQFRLDWETMWIEPCSDGDASHKWAGDPTTISSTFQGMLDLKMGKHTLGISARSHQKPLHTHAKMAVCFQRKTLSSFLACLATLPATPLTQPPNKISIYIPRAFFRINSPILPKSILATFWTPFSIAFFSQQKPIDLCPGVHLAVHQI